MLPASTSLLADACLAAQEKSEKPDVEFKVPDRLVCLLWHPSSPDSIATTAYEKHVRCAHLVYTVANAYMCATLG